MTAYSTMRNGRIKRTCDACLDYNKRQYYRNKAKKAFPHINTPNTVPYETHVRSEKSQQQSQQSQQSQSCAI